ncbi:S1C family serine protease [Marinicrinis sediminis]|uniref:S1C family serine protease n=1 Tax=Marinicrinis sediminis TaxID=1652465 RepID=A0ABW5R9A9_9BACL
MNDSNKPRNPYDDFFKNDARDASSENEQQPDRSRDEDDASPPAERPERTVSTYYAYGPYRSKEDAIPVQDASTESTAPDQTPVLMDAGSAEQTSSANRTWRVQQKPARSSGIKRMFASFLAGAVVVSGLMFAADRTNLFTDDPVQMQAASSQGQSTTTPGISQTAFNGNVSPDSFSGIVNQASPAVVKIETYASQSSNASPFSNDDFFRYFFGDQYVQPDNNNGNGQKRPAGMGSGFIFEESGYVLTNEHVVGGADEIYVEIQGHKEPYKAELLGSDFDLDLAVLKIESDKAFPTLKMGDSASLNVGDWVVAIGNPVGFDHTVSVGVLSQREREISIPDGNRQRNYEHLLQTDASINPGNSGGPLLNLQGEVIGVNTAVSTDAQGIGFAIPTSTILDVVEKLKTNETIPKPYIGVYLTDIEPAYLESYNLESTDGSFVTQLERGGPAAKAGIQPGDVVVEVDGKKVKNTEELIDIISSKDVGDKVNMVIIRDGKQLEAVVMIGDRSQS